MKKYYTRGSVKLAEYMKGHPLNKIPLSGIQPSSVYLIEDGVFRFRCPFNPPKGYTLVSFEEFKNNLKMEKEIIGYRLVKPEFEASAARIVCNDGSYRFRKKANGTNFAVSSITHDRLKQAGVLDLWFEPVYAEKETLKKGQWYWVKRRPSCCPLYPDHDALICYQGNEACSYGFNHAWEWTNEYSLTNDDLERITKAPLRDVEQALMDEACKRGLDQGGGELVFMAPPSLYYSKPTGAFFIGGRKVFSGGKWAKRKTQDLPIINGYKGEYCGSVIKYGCDRIPTVFFTTKEGNCKIKSTTLDSGIYISESSVEKIREYLRKTFNREVCP